MQDIQTNKKPTDFSSVPLMNVFGTILQARINTHFLRHLFRALKVFKLSPAQGVPTPTPTAGERKEVWDGEEKLTALFSFQHSLSHIKNKQTRNSQISSYKFSQCFCSELSTSWVLNTISPAKFSTFQEDICFRQDGLTVRLCSHHYSFTSKTFSTCSFLLEQESLQKNIQIMQRFLAFQKVLRPNTSLLHLHGHRFQQEQTD